MSVSSCCGAPDGDFGFGGYSLPNYSDIGICPECREHCDFIVECTSCGEIECECDVHDEESDKAVNAMLNRAAAYMALAIVAGYVAGVVMWPVLTR